MTIPPLAILTLGGLLTACATTDELMPPQQGVVAYPNQESSFPAQTPAYPANTPAYPTRSNGKTED